MKNNSRSIVIEKLIEQFNKLPGIGPKTAERLAFFFLTLGKQQQKEFSDSLLEASTQIRQCEVCHTFSESSPCQICTDPRRDGKRVCIVSEYKEMLAIERTGEFSGRFHILGGVLNPLQGVTPEQLNIPSLLLRLKTNPEIEEIILAINPNIEGETTMMYLAQIGKKNGKKVSRLARGIPVGSEIEYIDEMTLGDALKERREMQ